MPSQRFPYVLLEESFRGLLKLDCEADVVVDESSCVVVTLDQNRFQQNVKQRERNKQDLDVGNSVNAVFVGIDEDGGNGKAKEDEGTKESDLPDRNEPGSKQMSGKNSLKIVQ